MLRCSPEQDLADHRPFEIDDETPGQPPGHLGHLALKLITRAGATEVGVHLRRGVQLDERRTVPGLGLTQHEPLGLDRCRRPRNGSEIIHVGQPISGLSGDQDSRSLLTSYPPEMSCQRRSVPANRSRTRGCVIQEPARSWRAPGAVQRRRWSSPRQPGAVRRCGGPHHGDAVGAPAVRAAPHPAAVREVWLPGAGEMPRTPDAASPRRSGQHEETDGWIRWSSSRTRPPANVAEAAYNAACPRPWTRRRRARRRFGTGRCVRWDMTVSVQGMSRLPPHRLFLAGIRCGAQVLLTPSLMGDVR